MKIIARGMATTLAALSLTGRTVAGPVETVPYSFKGGADGGIPYAGLFVDQQGALFGATDMGGSIGGCNGYGCGTVFELTPPAEGQTNWTETVLYTFKGGADAAPQKRLIADQR